MRVCVAVLSVIANMLMCSCGGCGIFMCAAHVGADSMMCFRSCVRCGGDRLKSTQVYPATFGKFVVCVPASYMFVSACYLNINYALVFEALLVYLSLWCCICAVLFDRLRSTLQCNGT